MRPGHGSGALSQRYPARQSAGKRIAGSCENLDEDTSARARNPAARRHKPFSDTVVGAVLPGRLAGMPVTGTRPAGPAMPPWPASEHVYIEVADVRLLGNGGYRSAARARHGSAGALVVLATPHPELARAATAHSSPTCAASGLVGGRSRGRLRQGHVRGPYIVALLDGEGIERAGGHRPRLGRSTCVLLAMEYPERVERAPARLGHRPAAAQPALPGRAHAALPLLTS